MQEKIIFREMLSELKNYADTKNGYLTKEEIKDFFRNAHLEEQHFQSIYEYLASQKIKVEGFENGEMQEETQPVMQKDPVEDEKEDAFLSMYLEDLENVPPISPNEELKLYCSAAGGDSMAKSRLVEHHLRTVYEITKSYVNEQLAKSDLIQEGNIGLMLVVDQLKECKDLEEYQAFIKKEIIQALDDAEQEQRDLKQQDLQIVERVNYVNEAIKNLEEDFGHKVSIEELSGYLEMSMAELEEIIKMAGDEIDLDFGEEHNHHCVEESEECD